MVADLSLSDLRSPFAVVLDEEEEEAFLDLFLELLDLVSVLDFLMAVELVVCG